MSFKIKSSFNSADAQFITNSNDDVLEVVMHNADMTVLEHTIGSNTDFVICDGGDIGSINLTLPKITTKTNKITISRKFNGDVRIYHFLNDEFDDFDGFGDIITLDDFNFNSYSITFVS